MRSLPNAVIAVLPEYQQIKGGFPLLIDCLLSVRNLTEGDENDQLEKSSEKTILYS